MVNLNLFLIPYPSSVDLNITPFCFNFSYKYFAEILQLSKFKNRKFAEILFEEIF